MNILTGIRASDPQAASEAMRMHLENSLQKTIKRTQHSRNRKAPEKRRIGRN